jgi:hypothetical protein
MLGATQQLCMSLARFFIVLLFFSLGVVPEFAWLLAVLVLLSISGLSLHAYLWLLAYEEWRYDQTFGLHPSHERSRS